MIGQKLGHYRIVERIGAGGMGVVYRAHDEQLERDVALKILPAGLLAEEAARNRFRKEALALAKLNHPNIETVYEFGSAEGLDYLAMELIPGETVLAKLAGKSLPNRETARLGTQLAEGLIAAHEQGVIHRDLKPGNLMVMPDGRLKILDFGLARLVQPEVQGEDSLTISETTTAVSGTLPYMSPEQLRGLAVDARSDIFAAGAVLYEMATGRRPFPQRQSAELIGAILHQRVPDVSSANDRVAPGLAAIIHKCLEKDPQSRYQSARELRAALEGASSSSGLEIPARKRGLGLVAAAFGGAALLAVGIAFGLNVRGWRDRVLHKTGPATPPVSVHSVKARRSVAVLGFKNLSGKKNEEWLSTALSEMLTTELGAGETLRTVPGESVARTKMDLALAEADSFAPVTLRRIRDNLNSDYVVLGSYLALGGTTKGQIRLDVRLQDTSAGETIALVSDTGTEQDLPDLVLRAGAKLREQLGVGAVPQTEVPAIRSSQSSNQEAARLYAEGIAKLRAFDALGARDLLEKAVAADPDYPLAHEALANAWAALGYDEKAKDEAKTAFELSGKLPREDRLSIEAGYRELSKEWSLAQELYRTLWSFYPDNLSYGYSLAIDQDWAGKPREALATVEEMRRLPPPARDDPHIDQAELEAAASMGDFKRMQAAAARAADKGKTLGARRLVAQARIRECLAYRNLGQPAQAKAACEEAKKLYSDSGDRNGYAWALNNLASLEENDDPLAARRDFQEALAIYKQISQKHGQVAVLNNMGTMLRDQSKYAEAIQTFEQILPICREINDQISEGIALTNLANSKSFVGDLGGARQDYENAVLIYQKLGNKSFEAINSSNLAAVLLLMGDLPGAKKMLDRSQALVDEAGNREYRVYLLSGQGDVSLASGDLAEARRKYEAAIASAQGLGQKIPAAENQVSLAQLAIEEGHAADATPLLAQAIATFRSMEDSDDELAAQMSLAESLLAQDKLAEAQKHLDEAKPLVEKTQDPSARLQYSLTAARIRLAEGKAAEAEKSLRAALADATKRGFVKLQFEVRLALGERELKSGKAAEGRRYLATLEKDARSKGFLLVATKASEAQKAGK